MTKEHKFWNLWNGRHDVWTKFGPITPREAEIATQFAAAHSSARLDEVVKLARLAHKELQDYCAINQGEWTKQVREDLGRVLAELEKGE